MADRKALKALMYKEMASDDFMLILAEMREASPDRSCDSGDPLVEMALSRYGANRPE